ncbi:hypothetical protein WJX81_007789 [Elliptochloris bilobata]|uniref:Uncharacterized protein n=1 Tax=Elliptochloris bilobata TaxID=381761 RepID=A0AAW1S7N1_9CHLO
MLTKGAGAAAAATKKRTQNKEDIQKLLEDEPHKVFDKVDITVRAGSGGGGEVVAKGAGKMVKNFKYRARSSLPKQIFLPTAAPADGAEGASVVLVADPALDNLLHLHGKPTLCGRNGAAGNPLTGSAGPLRRALKQRAVTPPLRIPVPLGTVVKRRRGGALLGELLRPGQTLVVARGGAGGAGVVAPAKRGTARAGGARRRQDGDEEEEGAVDDANWEADAVGAQGEEVGLSLLMRVVADVGLVGLPNAGKSSLLAALTRAQPEIAAYPFTTLMPNLGTTGTGPPGGGWGDGPGGAVLADLPGLIEGAHVGRGLGRMFLRHLRRTSALLHVVDAATGDPVADYLTVRRELRLYNPEYCTRPHVVALNKADLLAADWGGPARAAPSALEAAILQAARQMQDGAEGEVQPSLPQAVLTVSATEGTGVARLNQELRVLLE